VKKLVIVVLIVLLGVAGWAGTTYVFGGKVEDQYFASLDQYGHWGPFQLTSESYERGFLSSRARTVLELNVPESAISQDKSLAGKPLSLTFEHILRHGPLPAGRTADGGFSMAPMMAMIETRLVGVSPSEQSLDEVLAELPQLRDSYAYTIIGLSGGGSNRLMVPAFEKSFGEKALTVNWGGLTCDTEFSRNLEGFAGNFVLPSLKVEMKDGHMAWEGISAEFDLTAAFPMVYVGSSEGRFGSLEMAFSDMKGESKQIAMKDLDVNSQSTVDGAFINYLYAINMAGITVDGEVFGPGLLEVSARNLDGEALSHFQAAMLQMYREDVFDPNMAAFRMLQIYATLFSELSKGSPEIEISRLQFATPMGVIDGNARVKFHGGEGLVLGDMQAMAKNFEAEAKVTVDEKLVRTVLAANFEQEMKTAREQGMGPQYPDEKITELAGQQVDGQLGALAQQNFFVRNDGKLSSHAIFSRGELLLNGQQPMAQP
jgi:uncharacterized protein YdgA (DUF945 family)